MRKIIIIIILFSSCQVQDNRSVPIPQNKTNVVPAKIKKATNAPVASQSSKNSTTIGQMAERPESTYDNSLQIKSATSTIILTENQVECVESGDAPRTGAKEEAKNNGGGSNYEEGYIPFIKQYW